jgi:dihydroflavonol-4-reductase
MITAVTGASGHIGGNLVRALIADGRKVRALVHRDARALDGLDVEIAQGDVSDPASLDRLMEDAGTVFHMAGRISIAGAEGGLVERTNVDGTREVVEACLRKGVRRLVHCSSIHAFSSEPDGVLDETHALALDSRDMPYDHSKAMSQRAVLDGVARGLDAVVINPTAVIGPNDFAPSRMGRIIVAIARRRLPALIDGGYDWVDARDVAAGAIAAEKRGRTGECYLLSGHWINFRDLSELIGRLIDRPTPKAAAPLWLALPASYASLAWGRLCGKTPLFTPSAVRTLHSHHRVSREKAVRELGYAPRPFEETIRDTVEWFRRAGTL